MVGRDPGAAARRPAAGRACLPRERPRPAWMTPPPCAGASGCAAVINCAGPFHHLRRAVVAGGPSRGCHYVDHLGRAALPFSGSRRFGAEAADAGSRLWVPGVNDDGLPSRPDQPHPGGRAGPQATSASLSSPLTDRSWGSPVAGAPALRRSLTSPTRSARARLSYDDGHLALGRARKAGGRFHIPPASRAGCVVKSRLPCRHHFPAHVPHLMSRASQKSGPCGGVIPRSHRG